MNMPKKYPAVTFTCAWCRTNKVISEMRHPSASKGKAPSTCHACRMANPDLSWCDFHNEPHAIAEFQIVKRPIPYLNTCKRAAVIKAFRKRKHPPIKCVSCGEVIESWNFRGGKQKSPTCRACEETYAGQRWCLDCAAWVDESEFNRTGEGGKFWTVRCRMCKNAHAHGVTVQFILDLQGSEVPECAACGEREKRISVDHDHSHCPGYKGCKDCVRGYLCHECNTAEGLLRTPQRARMLLEYMERISISDTAEVS